MRSESNEDRLRMINLIRWKNKKRGGGERVVKENGK